MEIKHEADEQDEGVCLQEFMNPLKSLRQMNSANLASGRALATMKHPEKHTFD